MKELRGLPPILIEIAEATGKPEIAWAILQELGGTKLYIPKKAQKNKALVRILGEENAALLSKHFGGILEDIPNCAALNSKKIAILDMEGTTKEIALKLKCTERYVRSVKNPPIDKDQLSLFDKA